MNQQQMSQCVQGQVGQPRQSEFCHGIQQQMPTANTPNFCHYPIQGSVQSSPFYSPQQMETNVPTAQQNILDQVRPHVGSTTPIIILPSSCIGVPILQPSPSINQTVLPTPTYQAYPPPLGPPCSLPSLFCCPPTPCFPYPVPLPMYDFAKRDCQFGDRHSKSCDGCQNSHQILPNVRLEKVECIPGKIEDHKCSPGEDDAICTSKTCSSSISLQTLASQFLSVPGVISSTVTRLLLRKIPGSNVKASVDETMEIGRKSIDQLTKDQLLSESRHAHQLNALVNLHVATKPPLNVLSVLTFLQLKLNSLKALVENLINRKLMENQGFGAESKVPFEEQALSLKSDGELRELFAALREKECEERVNLNFAPYRSQRIVAEDRLNCIRRKIGQVEEEFERRRRRDVGVPRVPLQCRQSHDASYAPVNFNCASVDPFHVQIHRPKRLNLKPHVGSPETTYVRPKDAHVTSLPTGEEESHQSGGQCSQDGDNADTDEKRTDEPSNGKRNVLLNENVDLANAAGNKRLVMQLLVMTDNDASGMRSQGKVEEQGRGGEDSKKAISSAGGNGRCSVEENLIEFDRGNEFDSDVSCETEMETDNSDANATSSDGKKTSAEEQDENQSDCPIQTN